MRVLLLAALLILSGCSWISERLYMPADSVQPLAPGLYRVFDSPNAVPVVRVTILGNGLTRISGDMPGEEPMFLGFVALDAAGHRYLVWAAHDPADPTPADTQMHFLAEKSSDGDYLFYAPDCEGRNAEIAVAAGATIEIVGASQACRFADRNSLEHAMREAVVTRDHLIARLARSGGRN